MPARDNQPAAEGCGSSFQSIFDPVKTELGAVADRLVEVIASNEPAIRDRLLFLLDHRGKMIRPALVLLSGKACGDAGRDHVELGTIAELIHSATLLHDDVIDRASVRRGRPSANVLWGNTAAVLLGDFLLSRAFALGIGLSVPGVSGRLAETAESICRGELLQNLHRGDWDLTESQYLDMIDGKTASLFACCAALGARAAGASDAEEQALEAYGRCLGRAFQMRDDLLDLVGSEAACGKTVGTDLAERKLTLPVIVWLRDLPAEERRQRQQALSAGVSAGELAEVIERSGAVSAVWEAIESLCGQACDRLGILAESSAKKAMIGLAGRIASSV